MEKTGRHGDAQHTPQIDRGHDEVGSIGEVASTLHLNVNNSFKNTTT